MFEIECFLDEAVWDLAACQITTIISLLGWKQISLGFPEVRGPLHTGDAGLSERVTSLKEIPFNQKKICDPPPDTLAAVGAVSRLCEMAHVDLKLRKVRVALDVSTILGRWSDTPAARNLCLPVHKLLQAGSELNTNDDQILGHFTFILKSSSSRNAQSHIQSGVFL